MDGRDLKLYAERTVEVQFLRRENAFLRSDRDGVRVELFELHQRFAAVHDESR